MALGDPYATPDELAVRLGGDVSDSYERLVDAASRAVESFTRRQFNREDPAEDDDYAIPRRFRALDRERVAVDDFYTIEDLAVEVNGTFWDLSSIDARPWDGIRYGQINWPYSDLFAINRSFPWSRRAQITVWAHWGWAAVPAGIVEATLDVAEVMSSAFTSGRGTLNSEALAGYSYSVNFATSSLSVGADTVPPEYVKALPFRRKVFGVA